MIFWILIVIVLVLQVGQHILNFASNGGKPSGIFILSAHYKQSECSHLNSTKGPFSCLQFKHGVEFIILL